MIRKLNQPFGWSLSDSALFTGGGGRAGGRRDLLEKARVKQLVLCACVQMQMLMFDFDDSAGGVIIKSPISYHF